MVDELTVDQVRKTCDPQSLGFETTGEIDPREGIIGQARALQALQFSLDIVDQGYNVYVAGIAVTGSLNQQGQVQAIGGANPKIEGFFEVCKARGLSGQQGVMIPHSNVQNLMLKEEVADAVRQGRFHIWPVRTVDEGIEILTGVPVGERDADGNFPLDRFTVWSTGACANWPRACEAPTKACPCAY